MSKKLFVSLVACGLTLASSSQAATLSWSSTAPTVDGADIASFIGASVDTDNIGGGDDAAAYIAETRPGQGQIFTTGGNSGGYSLSAITLQQVDYSTFSSVDTGWNGFNGDFYIYIGTFSDGGLTFNHDLLNGETAAMVAGAPANNNGDNGSGQFFTLTLNTSIYLDANSTYGFSIWSTADQYGGPYIEINGDGTTSGNYAGGEAFTEAGGSVVNYSGDRVFHLDIQAVPEPSTFALVGIGIAALVCLRRRA